MVTKQQVWVVIPENTPALARVFNNQKSAERYFDELFWDYAQPSSIYADAMDSGYFQGTSHNKEDSELHDYTLNSFIVEN